MLLHDNPKQIIIDSGIRIDELPKKLYKYRNFNNQTVGLFKNKSLWFSNPLKFNDPFDCQLHVQTNHTVDDIKAFIMKTEPSMALNRRNQLANKMTSNPQEYNEWMNSFMNKQMQTNGICCFGGCCDSILMWSHYGDHHKGFCLEFEWEKDIEFFTIPLPVNYEKDYPNVDYMKEPRTFIAKMIATKAECWNYEQEVRILKPFKKGLIQFNKKALSGVIFGAKCDNSVVNNIKELIDSNGFKDINLRRAVISKSAFKLDMIDK